MEKNEKYCPCPCCSFLTRSEPDHGTFEICPVSRYSRSAILAGLVVGTLATGAAFLWGPSDPSLEAAQRAYQESIPAWGAGAIVLIAGVSSIFISRIVLFYWVGYLWESLKSNPFRAVWLIVALWSIWIFPEVFYNSPADFKEALLRLPQVLIVHVATIPLLLYYWVRGGSIRAPAYFYAFLRIVPMALSLFFPQLMSKIQSVALWGTEVLLIVGYSWFLGIYSQGFWNKETNETRASSL